MNRKIAIALTAALIGFTVFVEQFSAVDVAWKTTWPVALTAAGFALLRLRYVLHNEPHLVTTLEGTALLTVFAGTLGIASYLLPEHSVSMWDAELVAVDQALGLESRTVILWTRQYPWLHDSLSVVYYALGFHLVLLVIYAAGIRRDDERAYRFLAEISITAIAGLALYAIFPAYNAVDFYHLDDPHQTLGIVEDLKRIRAREYGHLDFEHMLGLVQFPSFHVAIQLVLFADIIRNERRIVIALFFGWTAIMLWATVVIGAHYIIDLIGGLFITGLGVAVVTLLKQKSQSG